MAAEERPGVAAEGRATEPCPVEAAGDGVLEAVASMRPSLRATAVPWAGAWLGPCAVPSCSPADRGACAGGGVDEGPPPV